MSLYLTDRGTFVFVSITLVTHNQRVCSSIRLDFLMDIRYFSFIRFLNNSG